MKRGVFKESHPASSDLPSIVIGIDLFFFLMPPKMSAMRALWQVPRILSRCIKIKIFQ